MSESPVIAVQLQGTKEYASWVKGLADTLGWSVSMTAETALREFAQRHGFPAMPRRRPSRVKPA